MVRTERNNDGLTCQDVQRLLSNKFVVIIGDSIQRGIYKDLVSLLQQDQILSDRSMRAKGELTFMDDILVEGGVKAQLNNGINYTEVRQYGTNNHLVRFYFVTRCYNQYVESILSDLSEGPIPDLVIMNSCLWDMTRYGDTAIARYKENMAMLFYRLKCVLPFHCLMIWNTTLPISRDARGGFLVQEVEYKSEMLRMDVLEANYFARDIVVGRGFDVLDLHFWFRRRLDWRTPDGIHWCPEAHRRISEILLIHVARAWGFVMPPISLHHFDNTHPSHFHSTLHHFDNSHPGHFHSRTQSSSSSLPSVMHVSRDSYVPHRPFRHGPESSSYHRHIPYPMLPVHQTHTSYNSCRQGSDQSSSRSRCNDYGMDSESQFWNNSMLTNKYMSSGSDFSSQWTDFADDNFQGPHRRQNRSRHSRPSHYSYQ